MRRRTWQVDIARKEPGSAHFAGRLVRLFGPISDRDRLASFKLAADDAAFVAELASGKLAADWANYRCGDVGVLV
jgi:hypothetical protein